MPSQDPPVSASGEDQPDGIGSRFDDHPGVVDGGYPADFYFCTHGLFIGILPEKLPDLAWHAELDVGGISERILDFEAASSITGRRSPASEVVPAVFQHHRE